MEPDHNLSPTIQVQVSEPQNDLSGGYTTYMVSGHDQLGTFEIRRRFNDFFYLREALKKKWPGLYIPPITEKQFSVKKDENMIQMRKKFLGYFMIRLANIKHLFYSSVTQQFLRNKQIDMEKYYQTLGTPPSNELIIEFNKYFVGDTKVTPTELKSIMSNFSSFLKKAQKQLKTMKSQIGGIVEARNNFNENLNKCNSSMLPEYQKNVYVEYVQGNKKQIGLIFANDFKVQDNIRAFRDNSTPKNNPFQICLDLITYQGRQVQAMEEAIALRDQYQNDLKKLQQKCLESEAEMAKLSGGKLTFKSLFSKGSKNQQIQILEKQIPIMKKEIEGMIKLIEIINYVLSTVQIPAFKKQKQRQYYQMMNQISKRQLQYLTSYGQLMKSVMDGLKKSEF